MKRLSCLKMVAWLIFGFSLSAIIIVPGIAGADNQEARPPTEVKTDQFEGVIVTSETVAWYVRDLTGARPEKVWEPERADVLEMESRLADYLRKTRDGRSPDLWKKLTKYKRQYMGVIENGRKVIYTNFFCVVPKVDWKYFPVVVEDGGDCYFQIKYEVETKKFRDLQINGEA